MGRGGGPERSPLGLGAQDVEEYLRAVGQKLHARGVTGEILIFGGAYMLLVVRNREITKDIDAYLVSEPTAIREAVAEVAQERGLPSDWLNDALKGFLYAQPESTTLWAEYPGLRVYVPSAEYIFALKAAAGRIGSSDLDDLRALRRQMGLATLDEALAIVEKYIPARRREPRTQLLLESIFEEAL